MAKINVFLDIFFLHFARLSFRDQLHSKKIQKTMILALDEANSSTTPQILHFFRILNHWRAVEKTYELFHNPCVCVYVTYSKELRGENVKAKKFGHACQKLEKAWGSYLS